MKATIYHNPSCGTSRGALDILRAQGVEPTVIEYLKTPLTRSELAALVKQMNMPVRELVRWKEKDAVAAAGITEASDDAALLDAMAAHPILMNRPVVVVASDNLAPRAKLCRPEATVVELLRY